MADEPDIERILDNLEEGRFLGQSLAADFRGKGMFEDIPDASGLVSSRDFWNWKQGRDSTFNPLRYGYNSFVLH